MIIFVTGSTGFIGKTFLDKLLLSMSKESRAYLLQRTPQTYSDKRVSVLQGNMENISRYTAEILQSEYFVHIAADARLFAGNTGESGIVIPVKSIVNILQQSKLLKKIIFISSISAVDRSKNDRCNTPLITDTAPNPVTEYGIAKYKGEQLIIAGKLPYIIIRPAFVYGKNMRQESHINKFVSMVYKRNIPVYLNFPGKISVIHVDDLAQSIVNSININTVNKTYFAETESITIGNVFKLIYSKIYNKPLRQVAFPGFRFLFSRIHSKLPVMLSLLFLDYLYAVDRNFRNELLPGSNVKLIDTYINDVIVSNRMKTKRVDRITGI